MNLWGKQWLGIIGIVLFLFSCEEETGLGEPLNPNGDNIGVFFAEVPVSTSVILVDSVPTSGRFFVGKYQDPDFGLIHSQAFAEFVPENKVIKLPENLVIDSIVLSLRINRFHGVDFDAPSTINAHMLSEKIAGLNHFAFEKTTYHSVPVGSSTFSKNPTVDSLITIKLSPDNLYLNNWLSKTGNNNPDSTFKKEINGIALVPGEDNKVVYGFDLYHRNSKISMYYHNAADSVILLNYVFGLRTSSIFTRYGESYSNITTDRSQTKLSGITSGTEFQPDNNIIYIQPLTGIIPKVNIDNIKTFMESSGNIIINRADLVIGSVQPFSKFLEPPSSLSLYFTDDSNKVNFVYSSQTKQYVPFSVTLPGVDPSKAFEASISNESYRIPITELLEAYYLDKIAYNQFLVHPIAINAPPTLQQAKIPADNLKLKIYYTKLK
ncbi:MAG: DUF4270 domain-containing protein [Bacteroidota bacterium]|nr:DUF4270 domain-containing protein [Bacteroidota bacterium]